MNQFNEDIPKYNPLDAPFVTPQLIRIVSQELQIPSPIVRAVVENQLKTAYAALENNTSVELAGLGRFVLSEKKLLMIVKKYKECIIKHKKTLSDPKKKMSDEKRNDLINSIENLKKNIEYLENKAHEFKKD